MLKQTLKYIRYLFFAKSKHGIHSPFVFELVTNVINDKKEFPVYKQIENYRNELLKNDTEIDVVDLGAGSNAYARKYSGGRKNQQRKISKIAKRSLKRKKYAQLLYRFVNHFQPNAILELGTSLGITTLYLATAKTNANVITIEGSEAIAKQAQQLFERSGTKNITSVVGNFDNILHKTIEQYCQLPTSSSCQLDFVFIDGNHRKEPTLNYFRQCSNYTHNDSVFIFDDIHWSTEMEQAWNEIKKHPQVTVTLDLFEIGVVLFKKELSKENFIIRF